MGSLRNIQSEVYQDRQVRLWQEHAKKFSYNRGCLLKNEFVELQPDLDYFDYYRFLRRCYVSMREDLTYFIINYNYWIRFVRDYTAWLLQYDTAYGFIEEGWLILDISYNDYHEVVCFQMKQRFPWFQYWAEDGGRWTHIRVKNILNRVRWNRSLHMRSTS
jgi:hypothetical protein